MMSLLEWTSIPSNLYALLRLWGNINPIKECVYAHAKFMQA
jgi:hypothetical protein